MRMEKAPAAQSSWYAIAPPGQEGWLHHQEKAAKLLIGAAGVVVQ